MTGHHDDGVYPSAAQVRARYAKGEYGPEVEHAIKALLDENDRLSKQVAGLIGQLDHFVHGRIHD